MSNSATNLDLIAVSQAQKEATANALHDAGSPATVYGRRASTTGGLVWGYYGGAVMIAGEPSQIANGTLTLAASATNYIEADLLTGEVSVNSVGFTAGRTRLYTVVAGSSTVASYTDHRVGVLTLGTGVTSVNGMTDAVTLDAADVGADAEGTAAAALAAHAAADDPHPNYLTKNEADTLYATVGGGEAQPFDLTAFYPGTPTASALVTRVPIARAVTFPAGLVGSIGTATAAATASAAFKVQKNGADVGAITFAAGATSATFTAADPITFAAGDLLSIIAPATADDSLTDVGFVLAGTR